MEIMINALSTTNLSGRHVLLGHLDRLSAWGRGRHRFTILHHNRNRDIRRGFGKNVEWVECPDSTAHWASRTWWERRSLPELITTSRPDLLVTLSGAIIPGLPVRQVSYALNPEPMIRGLKRGPAGNLKSALQRCGYRRAMGQADLMLFVSSHLRELYRKQAGFREAASQVVYAGINPSTFATAASWRGKFARKTLQLVTVSVMAAHKRIETLLEMLYRLKRRYRIRARLLLIGPWPDPGYARKIRRQIRFLSLNESVDVRGFVTRSEMHRLFAESKLFCLLSRAESFGIPGLEAQAFGTPVLGSNGCAIPETCGPGGVYTPAEDPKAASREVARLLSDEASWSRLSNLARRNALKFRWENCSRPLFTALERFEKSTYR